ncbi:hypothetical protein ID866_9346 [Astraeus odoratus]|nr:hypothetical protein ID866_9346 [Astraeus odoratus]
MKKFKFGRSAQRVDSRPAMTPSSTSAIPVILNQVDQVQSREDGRQHVQEESGEPIAGNSESISKVHAAALVAGAYGDQDGLQLKLNEAKGAFQDVKRMNAKCIQVLKALKTLGDAGGPLTTLNPIARVAVGLFTNVAQIIIDQNSHDNSVSDLLPKIQEVFDFLMARDTLEYINIDAKASILVQLGEVVNDCVEFITKYSKRKNIGMLDLLYSFFSLDTISAARFGKHFLLDMQSEIDDFKKRMDTLMLRYQNHTLQSTHVTVARLSEDIKICSMTCAAGVGLMKTKTCLEGTRMQILAEIMSWINDSDVNVPRILWLRGQAGKGKSAIAHTIAMWFKDMGKLGSCFCFARDRQAEHEQKMFATIAHDMMICDPLLRRAVAAAVSADDSLRTTLDVIQQWEGLILEPVSKVSDAVIGKVVIVIDALDESGSPSSREHILSILGSKAVSLPPCFRIFLTSRPLPDIEQALVKAPHVRATSLDEVPTSHDIHLYVSKKLGSVRGIGDAEIERIVEKSDGLFEWARLACEFIKPSTAGETARERFNDLMKRGSEEGRLLDSMYRAILETAIGKRPTALERFRSVMQQVLSALEPLTMHALSAMRSVFPDETDHYDVDIILGLALGLFVHCMLPSMTF